MKGTFGTYSRDGTQSLYTDLDNPEVIARELIDELRAEQYDKPDDEHSDVSIFRDNWSIAVNVFGRVTLSDLSWVTGSKRDSPKNAKYMAESLYMRDVPDELLVSVMVSLARGEFDRVRSAAW